MNEGAKLIKSLKIFSTLVFLGLLALIGCNKTIEPSHKETVLVTVAPYIPIVTKLTRGVAHVECVLDENQNIHFFSPTPKDMERISKASIWFGIGEPFEKKMLPTLREHHKLQYINLAERINLITSSEECDHHYGGKGKNYDLHIWMSPIDMEKQAKKMAQVLISWKPELSETIQRNLEHVLDDLDHINHAIIEKITPYKGDALLLGHPSLAYFCRTYELRQLSIECEGKDPSPRDIEKLLIDLRKAKVRAAFAQPQFDNRALIKIADDLDIPIFPLNVYSEDYYGMLLKLSDEISK